MDDHRTETLYQIRRQPRVKDDPWRTFAELAPRREEPPKGEFFPKEAERPELDRRLFLQLTGATLGLAGVGGCTLDVPRKILPYSDRPAQVLPGVPAFYATSMVIDGYAAGLVVESHEGRPTKIEANLQHPATLGGTSMFHQAAVRQLYDDMRGRSPRRGQAPTSWEDLFQELERPRQDRGAGLRLLLTPTASPLQLSLLARVRRRYPRARFAFFAPLAASAHVEATRAVFGRPLLPQYDFSGAQAILSFDADFLCSLPFSLRYARQWANRHRLSTAADQMNRLYVVESLLSVTGSVADNRLRRRLSEIPAAALALAAHIPGLPTPVRAGAAARTGAGDPWLTAAARDLTGRPRGTTVVLVGDRQPPALHALAYAMNEALGNVGRTVSFIDPVIPVPGEHPGLEPFDALVGEMHAGSVDTLLIFDTNPSYAAPADLDFDGALSRVRHSMRFGYYEDETANRSTVFGPTTHFLESWGDARAYDGTVSLIQPLIRPLVNAQDPTQLLATLAGEAHPEPHRLLHEHWLGAGMDEAAWSRALQDGLVVGTAAPAVSPTLSPEAVARLLHALPPPPASSAEALELELYPSPTVYDGRFANNAWLLEQPEPITKLTWDNAALMSVATAQRLGLSSENVVELQAGGATARVPVLVVPGLADQVVALWLGYGRTGQEALAAGIGVNAYPFRTRRRPHHLPVGSLTRVSGYHTLAQTQLQFSMDDRPIAFKRTLAEYRRDPDFTREYKGPVDSILPEVDYRGPQWAMSVDLSICIGCSACMTACQSENNLLIVGKANVLRHRQMHWLRIDTYYSGLPDAPGLVHQPMLCQHCEKAPCEYVCPVNATVHSPDGLNEMIYNRCVGTRFCSNNCPYKVRRFNWFDFTEQLATNRGMVQLHYNPEVTVRERGVMEKCTYCVQRIRAADIAARIEQRDIRPGEIVTACQAACPTGAIQFDSLTHRDTPMVRWRQQDRSFAVLHDQGTQPRTYYLARIENPNPEIG